MKRFLLLMLGIVTALTMSADPVGREQAAKLASRYMSGGTKPALVQNSLKKASTNQSVTPPIYIFSRGEGQGFVIVSGDDSMPAILGVVESGDYDESTLPPALVDMINGWIAEITARQREYPTPSVLKKAPQRAAYDNAQNCAPLLGEGNEAIKWDQGSPFNLLCPVGAGSTAHAQTGCTSTAGAQLMYYWYLKGQADGKDYVPANLLYDTPIYSNPSAPVTEDNQIHAGTAYNWAAMTKTYSNASSEDSKNAVATLMATIGLTQRSGYRVNGTSSTLSRLGNALASQFNMKYSYASRANDDEAWIKAILADLEKGWPVAYGGVNPSTGSGHAFILDGFRTSDNLFHFNFGWGTNYTGDGWFALTTSAGTLLNYSSTQSALCGLHPISVPDNPNISVTLDLTAFEYGTNNSFNITVTNNDSSSDVDGLYVMISPYDVDCASAYTFVDGDNDNTVRINSSENFTFSFTPTIYKQHRLQVCNGVGQELYSMVVPVIGTAHAEQPTFEPYAVVTTDDWTDNVVYTLNMKLFEYKTSARGYLSCDGTDVKSIVTRDESGNSQQFAIVKDGDEFYLWSIAARKFVSFSGATVTLNDTPANTFVITKAGTTDKNRWRLCTKTDNSKYITASADNANVAISSDQIEYNYAWYIEAVGELAAADRQSALEKIGDQKNVKPVPGRKYIIRAVFDEDATVEGVTVSKHYLTYAINSLDVTQEKNNATAFECVKVGSAYTFKTAAGKYLNVPDQAPSDDVRTLMLSSAYAYSHEQGVPSYNLTDVETATTFVLESEKIGDYYTYSFATGATGARFTENATSVMYLEEYVESPTLSELPYTVTSLDQITEGDVYTLQCNRGYLTYGATMQNGSSSVGDNQKYAIIKGKFGYYLWNVAGNKFVPADGNTTIANPNGVYVLMPSETSGRWIVKNVSNNNWMQLGGNNQFTVDDCHTQDGGNKWEIQAVDRVDVSILAAAKAAIEQYESTANLALDVTVDVTKSNGSFFNNKEGSGDAASMGTDADNVSFKPTFDGLPAGAGLVIARHDGNSAGVGNRGLYTDKDGLSFTATTSGVRYDISVADGFYILSYSMTKRDNTTNAPVTLTSEQGNTCQTGTAANSFTNTVNARSTYFTAKHTGSGNNYFEATSFTIRVVNAAGLHAIVNDIHTGVGYPKTTTTEYQELVAAVNAFNEAYYKGQDLTSVCQLYCAKWQAYINCTDIEMPAEAAYYTLSFLNYAGTAKYRLRYNESGYSIVPYVEGDVTDDDVFFTYKFSDGKYGFMNMHGKWLVFKGNSRGQNSLKGYLDEIDDTYCNFTLAKVAGSYVDNKERSLGTLSMSAYSNRKNDGTYDTDFYTINNAGTEFNQGSAAFYRSATDATSAIVFEEVDRPMVLVGHKSVNGTENNDLQILPKPTVSGTLTPWTKVLPYSLKSLYFGGDYTDYAVKTATLGSDEYISNAALLEAMNSLTSSTALSLDITRDLTFTLSFVDKDGNAMEGVTIVGGHGVDNANHQIKGTSTGFYFYDSFGLTRNVVSYKAGGTTYDSWQEMVDDMSANANAEVKLGDSDIKYGQYYVIRHKSSNRLVYKKDNNLGTLAKSLPLTASDINYVFRFEDAGDGRFYIYNVGGDVYAKRAATTTQNTAFQTTAAASKTAEENAYRLINGLINGSPEIYGLVGASDINNPLEKLNSETTSRYFWHVNTGVQSGNIINWNCTRDKGSGSHWLIEEITIPVVTVTSIVADGEVADDVTLVPTGSDAVLASQNKMLSWTTALAFGGEYDHHRLTGGSLTVDGTTTNYSSADDFFAALNALTQDATATLNITNSVAVTHKYLLGGTTYVLHDEVTELLRPNVPYTPVAPTIANYTLDNKTWTDGEPLTEDVTITYNYRLTSIPFEASTLEGDGSFGSGMKWYLIWQQNSGGHWSCDDAGVIMANTDNDNKLKTLDHLRKNTWAFVSDGNMGYHIYSYYKGTTQRVSAGAYQSNANVEALDAEGKTQAFVPGLNTNSTGAFALFLSGTSNYIDRSSNKPIVWKDSYATNSSGAQKFSVVAITADDMRTLASTYLSNYATEQLADLNTAITNVNLTAYFAALTTLDGITPPVTELTRYMASLTETRDEVGYMTSEALAAAWADAKAAIAANNPNQAYTAKAALEAAVAAGGFSNTNVKMPEDGHAYRMGIIHQNRTDRPEYLRFTKVEGAVTGLGNTDQADQATVFICRHVQREDGTTGYMFVDQDYSAYLIWKGNSNGANNNNGFYAYSPNNYTATNCALKLVPGQQPTSEKGPLGTFHVYGYRSQTGGTNESAFIFKFGTSTPYNFSQMDGSSATASYYNATYSSAMKFEEVEYTANEVEFKAAAEMENVGYVATFSFPARVALPEGVKAYWAKATTVGGKPTISMAEVKGAVPARQGVVLVGQNVGALRALPAADEVEDDNVADNNKLVGSPDAPVPLTAGDDAYILTRATPIGSLTSIVGFFRLTVTSNLAQYKAYLKVSEKYETTVDTSSGVRSFINLSWGDIENAIADIEGRGRDSVEGAYDLSGRRVGNPRKGLFIVNGKKVIR